MTVDILIATCLKDMAYLEYCVKSVHKFASGFNRLVLVVAQEEEPHFRKFCEGAQVKTYQRTPDQVKWQIAAQAQKCMADLHCEADFIFMMDSDCVFIEPVTPADYFVSRKPVMLYESYLNLPGCPWREPTEKALGWPVEHEFMRRHGQTLPRRVFFDMRERIQNLHQMPFENYVLAQKPTFPWFFSEHNCLGAYAFHDPHWRGEIHWVNLAMHVRPKDKLYQAWSHSPPHLPQALPIGGNGVPLELYQKLGL